MNYNIRNNNVNLTQIHITLPDNYIQESFYYFITFITDVSRLLGQICTLTKILQEALFSQRKRIVYRNKNFLYDYISVGLQQNSIPRDFKILWEVFMTFKKYSSVESSFISEKI